MNDIGGRIKYIRKINNMIQIDFAALMGISQGTLSEIEKGKLKPSVETLYEIKKHFKIDLNWLVMGGVESSQVTSLDYELIRKTRELDLICQKEIEEFIEFKIHRKIRNNLK
ncbi:helix-turn-helix transcriptional regulator [Brevibacillus centrosporus]|uniref:helix-turn-helix domain-containing protein n=1 Tax=Brevibacillus centrosporus TaxID=54910 RepID=UPI000F0A8114|nr:helix-turn-helix transcriptional regulator [Brevibacillus centrosporus]MEC2132237.1 helix-turn-helix transcriptional regulator [Brevibacillus centrosporus]MED4907685.1 helix-turn-helix transcriptional regulator [Brevibacillus centrosporus]RNB64536.1 XRE family transcriptional regulator [Brevibacillus centrosporus]GED33252.1 hypothetical protein BCE02nite_43930 [Brevibacillus centrosporus]